MLPYFAVSNDWISGSYKYNDCVKIYSNNCTVTRNNILILYQSQIQ